MLGSGLGTEEMPSKPSRIGDARLPHDPGTLAPCGAPPGSAEGVRGLGAARQRTVRSGFSVPCRSFLRLPAPPTSDIGSASWCENNRQTPAQDPGKQQQDTAFPGRTRLCGGGGPSDQGCPPGRPDVGTSHCLLWDGPMRCRMLSSVPGLCLLDASAPHAPPR